jgi:hypothetical protein
MNDINVPEILIVLTEEVANNWIQIDENPNSENYFHLVLFEDDIQLRTGSIDYYSGGGIDAIELVIDADEVADKEHLKNIIAETVDCLLDSLY